MLEPIIIKETEYSPEIILNQNENIFQIKGKSLMEDANSFYLPVIAWAQNYVQNPNNETEIEIDLEYYNSTSARRIVKFLLEFEKIKQQKAKIIWKYTEGDNMLLKRGLELQQTMKIPIEFIKTDC